MPSTSKEPGKSYDEDAMSIYGSGSSSDDASNDAEALPYPPAYWEEKVAKSINIIEMLQQNPEMKRALIDNPILTENLMKHPDIAKEVAKDHTLAKLVIATPKLVMDLALAKREIATANLKTEREAKRRIRRLKQNQSKFQSHRSGGGTESETVLYHPSLNPHRLGGTQPGHGRHGHHDTGHGVTNRLLSLRGPSIARIDAGEGSSEGSRISRATMPNVRLLPGEPESLKYLIDTARLYLTHHVAISDGFSTCCDVVRDYYDILNVYGRLMYRVYQAEPSTCKYGIFRPFEMAVKEPDGSTAIVMTKRYDLLRCMRKISVFCPPGTYIGCVEEKWGICNPKMILRNKEGDAMIQIRVVRRPFMSRFTYHPDFEFEMRTIGAHNAIGKIAAEWLDLPPGAFPNEKIYGINFPRELSCNVKIIVMTAWFLVYNLYFNGKMKKLESHTLGDNERSLLEYSEGQPRQPEFGTDLNNFPSDSEITVAVKNN